ncbi:hypothetical protein COB57_03705 [Candidatus Peregrinibacteria bacterium]|nr:MAG: hypothetical protein COB57_03705 [Candidatus Peregrinibacteria bacterium]
MKKIAIIGAGPAGISTACFLKDFAGEVLLFEQNKRIGEKLRITGGGRMNVTNKKFSDAEFFSKNTRVLSHVFRHPYFQTPQTTLDALGVEYIWEDNRAILASGSAPKEVGRFHDILFRQKNLSLHFDSEVIHIEKQDEQFSLTLADKSVFVVDRVVLSGGGMFRLRDNKSSQGIYALATQLGHTLCDPQPSLSPLVIKDHPFVDLSGVSHTVTLFEKNKKNMVCDSIIFTHEGISGPGVLDFSAHYSDDGFYISFLPDMKEDELRAVIKKRRDGKNIIADFFIAKMPKSLFQFFEKRLNLPKHFSELSKENEKKLIQDMCSFFVPSAMRKDFTFCWTTQGGIDMSEISANSFESKKVKNLFFAGEIVDINGLCGGYNISFAYVSGRIVGEGVGKIRV